MRRLLSGVIFLLALCATGVTVAESPRDPYQYFFNETFGDFSEELEQAREQGKRGVVIFFEMDDCPFCHYMKGNVLNQPSVQEYYRQNFLLFSVDVEGDIEIVDFTGEHMSQKDFAFKKNRVRATPVIAFFDLAGNRVHRHTGKTSGVEEFMLIGRYVAEGHYEMLPFARFKREYKN
ncbi:MAG: thioredoxin family protein [Gammaproteobacteria bacterium]|nr:thioredoxin family protein [Gammaproteobacteria bacterium]